MLSRINDFINPLLPKNEASGSVVGRPEQKNHDKGGKKDDGPAEEKQDDTYFSIEAIRALLKQENVDVGNEVIACLDLLQKNGIASIAIRNEQSIVAAIVDAATRFKG